MITPLGHRLLVQPEDLTVVDPILARAKAAGLQLLDTEREREQAAVDRGTVVAIGSTAYLEMPNSEAWCKVGDFVAYTRYGGKLIKDPDTGIQYIILNDDDIICKFGSKEQVND